MWLKLNRIGNTFTGYGSSDGGNWTLLGTATIAMPTTVYAGLAVSGAGYLEPATFDSVTVTPTPSVSTVSPGMGPIGTAVTITGTNFGTTQGTSNVWFNGVPATSITSWTSSQIVAIVPVAATSGTGLVTVTVNNIPSEGSSYFTVINPIITSLVPPSGEVGGTIAVNGSGFGASQNGVVSINGVTATVQSWSDALVQVTVPSTTTGPLTVSNDGVISNSQTFTVSSAVAITSISPSSGMVATPVTINGTGFGASQSNSVVEFGGATATATSWTNSQIIASVPANAVTGAVTVTVAGITATGPTFTVSFGMTLTSSANPSTVNIPVTFTANVTPLAATGTVKFKDGSTTLGTITISNGIATFTTSTLTAGSHSITAVYSGNSSYPTSTSPVLTESVMTVSSITVSPATLSLPLSSVERYVATAVHSDNSTQVIPSGVTWASTNTATATIDSTGLMTAVGQGTTTVQATFNSVTGSSSLTVGVASFRSVGSLNTSRAQHTATLLQNGKVLIVGGQNNLSSGNDTTLASSEIYDPVSQTFSLSGSLNTPRSSHTATLLPNGKVLIAGGEQILDSYGDIGGVFTLELYDPTSGTFSVVPGSLTEALSPATLLNNGMVLFNESLSGFYSGNVGPPQLYDPSTGIMSNTGYSVTNRVDGTYTSTLLNDGTVLLAGGEAWYGTASQTTNTELFSPATETFAATGSLVTPTMYQTATLLNTGSVLLAAGANLSGTNGSMVDLNGAELYNPTAKTFATTGSLAIARTSHTATLLNDGTVLVIGGGTQTAPTYLTGTAELYSPTNQTFTGDGSLQIPRFQHTATLLNDGTVLVVGGGGGNGLSLTSAELYAPPLPAPTSVTISPALTSMVVGQTQQFKALDQTGAQRYDVTWSVNNPSLASFTAGVPMILTATSEGVVTLTATVEGVAAQLQIAISPSWLQVTPSTVNMYVTGTQQFTAVDNSGYAANNVTWTVSNPSLATITTANPTVLTATAAGTLTLTATSESVSAQAQITISPANTVFPAGTILWSDPPAPGFTAMQIAQAVPTATGPDLYSTSVSADGTQSIIQALQADGEQLWQIQTPAVLNNSAVPDGFGGLIVTSCPSGNPMTVSDFGPTGQLLWQELAAGVNTGNGTITYLCGAPYIAVRGDGAVVVTEATNVGLPSVTVNGEMYSIPPSTVTNAFGTTIDVLCCVGPPMVNTDGTTYLEYEVRNTVNEVVTADTLYLMQINPDNSSSSTVLSSTTQNETQYPGNIIPDGNGGVLATWSVSVVQGTQLTYPYQAVDVSGGFVGMPYNLPFSPQSVNIAQQPSLVLGENGVAFASGMTTANVNGTPTQVSQIASFNTSSGSTNWTYQAQPNYTLSIISSALGNGLAAKTTDDTGNDNVVRFDSSGNASFDDWGSTASGIDFFIAGDSWIGSAGTNSFGVYSAPPVDLSTSSWFRPAGLLAKAARTDFNVTGFSQTGANQSTITGVLQALAAALPSYSSCNTWLQGGLQEIQYLLNPASGLGFGHGTVRLGLNATGAISYTTGAFTGSSNSDFTLMPGLPASGIIMTVNDAGAFFNATAGNNGGPLASLVPPIYQGNTPQIREEMLLHELAHQVGAAGFQPDGNDPGNVIHVANDTLLLKNCGELIAGPSIKSLSPNSGSVGTSVTITGAGFGSPQGSGTVVFNANVAATVSSWADNQIVVTVPIGATTGNVAVTVSGGQSATKKFTVN
jgi:hypothetical protein